MIPPREKLLIREGGSGILTMRGSSGEQTVVPNYNAEEARALLLEFQEIRDTHGGPLKSNYETAGYDWYPAMVSYLYWCVFFPFVKYGTLAERFLKGELDFECESPGQFHDLISLLDGSAFRRPLGSRLQYLLSKWNNRLVTRGSKAELLFFRFARTDFRTIEIRKVLDQCGSRRLDAVPAPAIRELLTRILRGGEDYLFAQPPSMGQGNQFRRQYDLPTDDPVKRQLFATAIRVVEHSITSLIIEFRHHLRALRRVPAKVFYGLDDINSYVFPLLYACRTLGIRTIGHQHGAYVKCHAGYMMEGIDPKRFVWFDRVIVWGQYWKEKMLRDSRVYGPDFFILGANKFTQILPPSEPREGPLRTILIPYEFLADTARIGAYMQRLMDLGYRIIFKVRADEEVAAQVEAYGLPDAYRERIEIAAKLDASLMATVDIVAGTMTTLIYEILSCNKVVWILETAYHHLYDLVEEGLAHLVRYEDLANLPAEVFRRTCLPVETLFGTESLETALQRNVLSCLPAQSVS